MNKSIPDTGGILSPVKGAVEAEAAAELLRGRIDNAEDCLNAVGNKFYVSENGNDSNDGSSPEKAFRTLGKIAGMELKPGDGVFFERGSTFRSSSDFELVSGVTYAAYGEGEKPEFYGSRQNYAQKDIWVPTETPHIWKIAYFPHSDVGIIVLDGGRETGKKQKLLCELTENDDFYHDWDTDVLYFYCDRGNPGEVFDDIEIGIKTRIFHLAKDAHDITVDNISFRYTGLFGIRADGKAKNITVTNCKFAWIGGSFFNNKSNRFGNGIEFAAGCEDITVKNCGFYQIYDSAVTFQICGEPYRNFTVEDCLFEYNGMSGFEWFTGGDCGEKDGIPIDITQVENILIKNNIMRFTGFGWSKATRCPAHIRNGWRVKWYPNLKNFVITHNIFDCANGQIIAFNWQTPPEGYTVCGNSYYQQLAKTDEAAGKYIPFTLSVGKGNAVSNKEEFIRAVREIDENPEKIEWIAFEQR